MISILFRPLAMADFYELNAFWGARFRNDFNGVINRLTVLPRSGHPFPRPTIPDLLRILLRGCQCYLYYVYDEKKQLIRVLRIWSNRRDTVPL